jgi:hypothetical protein
MSPRRSRLKPVGLGLATTSEIELAKLPSVLNSDIWADAWKPVGHPSVVEAAGVSDALPLAGVRLRLPGSEPFAASANPAASSPAPVIMPVRPKSKAARRTILALRHMPCALRMAL